MANLRGGNFRPSTDGYLRISNDPLTTWVRKQAPIIFSAVLILSIAAPEYALDEQLLTASDMYSLGCLVYAVHCKGSPPYKTHGSLGGLRDNAGKPLTGIDRLDKDLQCTLPLNRLEPVFLPARCVALLRSLITRHATPRPTPATLPSHSFFSSLPISTLNFLDRSNFTAKTREEKVSFMKGLTGVLDRFSEGLRTRKVLPSLLEEVSQRAFTTVFTIAEATLVDERHQFITLHPPKCLRNLQRSHSFPVCQPGAAEPQTTFRGQGASTEYVNLVG